MPHNLPEDESKWPRDPWRVLGVSRGDDEQKVRRAYAALIRQFKPDAFPGQFQRIRQSYETVLAQVQPGRKLDSPRDDAASEERPVPVRTPSAPNVEPEDPSNSAPAQPVIDPSLSPRRQRKASEKDSIAEAWQIASERGFDEASAYLRQPQLEASRNPELRLLEYWFKRLSGKTPAAEREELLFATPGKRLDDHRFLFAYVAALQDDAEALTERCRSVLLAAPVDVAWRIARIRWKALAATGAWSKLNEDLVQLTSNPSTPLAARVQLMLEVADLRVWETSGDHTQFWEQSKPIVEEWLNDDRAARALGDRWDVLMHLRSDCARLEQSAEFAEAARPFHRLLRAMTTASPRQTRLLLAQELQQWRFNPGRTWRRLTAVRQETPTLFFELSRRIDSHKRLDWEFLPPARLAAIFNDQIRPDRLLGLDADAGLPPAVARAVYEFCVRSACPMSNLVHALTVNDRDSQNPTLGLLLRNALPLDLLITGSQLFWEL